MFGFLKDKLKSALGKLTKEVEKDAVVEKKEVLVEKPKDQDKKIKEEAKNKEDLKKKEAPKVEKKIEPAKKPVEAKKEIIKQEIKKDVLKQDPKPEIKKEIIVERKVEEKKEIQKPEEKPAEKKGFFSRLFSKDKEEVKETKKDSEDIIESKEELRQAAEKTDIEPVNLKEVQEKKKESKEENKKEIKAAKKTEPKQTSQIIKKERIVVAAEPKNIEEKAVREEKSETEYPKIIEEKKEEKVIEEKIIPKHHVHPDLTEKSPSRNQELEKQREEKVVEHKEEEKKGFFTKITETFTKIQITEDKFEELFWDLEVAMLENNVAVEVIDKIKRDLKKELMSGKISRSGVEELIASTLKKSIIELFDVEKINLIDKIKSKQAKPYIISIIGVNGSGKTTSIAKLAHKLQKEGLSVVLAASDTFRAAAIQQLEEHANRLNVKMIKHDYNSDPAAVAFDAIKYAQARNVDVVLIDTAGRLHSNTNLMRELEKIVRVCKPDIKIFVGESITGNDCVEQAKEFDNAVGIDAIILAKADIDDKGGAAISVSYILQRPILYLGTGQTYDDLKEFDSSIIVEGLGL